MRLETLFISVFFIAATFACGQSTPVKTIEPATTACQAKQAQILVGDGYLQNLCGCQEAAGITAAPGVFQCSVPVGTTITFLFLINKTTHELIPQSGSSFNPGPISNPADELPVRAFGQSFSAAGSFLFADAFNSNVTGKIIVF